VEVPKNEDGEVEGNAGHMDILGTGEAYADDARD